MSIVRLNNSTFWRGTTGPDGVVLAPETPLRDPDNWYEFAFIVQPLKIEGGTGSTVAPVAVR